jgi:hypothetical protein
MSDPVITNLDTGSVMIQTWGKRQGVFRNPVAAPTTYVAGTVLALDTVDGKMYPFLTGGATGRNIPKYILTSTIATLASSDNQIEAVTAGIFDQGRIVQHPAIALTAAELDLMLNRPLIPVLTKQLAKTDNPLNP